MFLRKVRMLKAQRPTESLQGEAINGTIAVIKSGVPEMAPIRLDSLNSSQARVYVKGSKLPEGERVSLRINGLDPNAFELPVTSGKRGISCVSIRVQAKVLSAGLEQNEEKEYIHLLEITSRIRIV